MHSTELSGLRVGQVCHVKVIAPMGRGWWSKCIGETFKVKWEGGGVHWRLLEKPDHIPEIAFRIDRRCAVIVTGNQTMKGKLIKLED